MSTPIFISCPQERCKLRFSFALPANPFYLIVPHSFSLLLSILYSAVCTHFSTIPIFLLTCFILDASGVTLGNQHVSDGMEDKGASFYDLACCCGVVVGRKYSTCPENFIAHRYVDSI